MAYNGETFSYDIDYGADAWHRFRDAFQQSNFSKWLTILSSEEELEAFQRNTQYSCHIQHVDRTLSIEVFGNISSEDCKTDVSKQSIFTISSVSPVPIVPNLYP